MQEMLRITQSHISLENNMNTLFKNYASTDAHSNRPLGKDDPDERTHDWYDKYTLLNESQKKIYQECAITKFWK